MQSVRCNNVNTDGAADKKFFKKKQSNDGSTYFLLFLLYLHACSNGHFSASWVAFSPSSSFLLALDVRTILSPQKVFWSLAGCYRGNVFLLCRYRLSSLWRAEREREREMLLVLLSCRHPSDLHGQVRGFSINNGCSHQWCEIFLPVARRAKRDRLVHSDSERFSSPLKGKNTSTSTRFSLQSSKQQALVWSEIQLVLF